MINQRFPWACINQHICGCSAKIFCGLPSKKDSLHLGIGTFKIFTNNTIQVNLDMTDSMGPGKLVRHMQNLSYTYDEYLICIRLGPSISSVICKNPSYSGPSYPSSPVVIFPLRYSTSVILLRILPASKE